MKNSADLPPDVGEVACVADVTLYIYILYTYTDIPRVSASVLSES